MGLLETSSPFETINCLSEFNCSEFLNVDEVYPVITEALKVRKALPAADYETIQNCYLLLRKIYLRQRADGLDSVEYSLLLLASPGLLNVFPAWLADMAGDDYDNPRPEHALLATLLVRTKLKSKSSGNPFSLVHLYQNSLFYFIFVLLEKKKKTKKPFRSLKCDMIYSGTLEHTEDVSEHTEILAFTLAGVLQLQKKKFTININ
jgi:hypothetical protein